MAKIPDENTLGTHRWSSPRMVARVDENALAAPGRAQARMGEAIAGLGKSIGGALSAVGAEDRQAEEYATHTKFLDFDQKQNDYFVEQERSMNPDGAGFRQGITSNYDTAAREFFKDVPDHLKPKYDDMLRRRGIDYERKARDKEYVRRDEWHLNDVNTRLGGEKALLEQNPDNLRDAIGRGISLIDASRLPQNIREQRKQEFVREMERRHIELRLQRGDDPDQVLKDIETRPSSMRPQTDENGNPVRQEAPAAAPAAYRVFDTTAPTVDERRAIAQQGGIVVNLDTNWAEGNRPTAPMVVIPDNATPEQRQAAKAYASAISDLYREKFGTYLAPSVKTRSENGRGRPFTIHTEPFSVNDVRAVDFFMSDDGRKAHADILRRTFGALPGVAFSVPHDPTGPKKDRGAVGPRGSEVDIASKLIADLKGSSGDTGTRVAGFTGRVEIGVNKFVSPKTPGVITAAAEQTSRAINDEGYGGTLSGKITVNGRTYDWVSGGRRGTRGSIPTGTYEIQRFTSGDQRAQEGKSFRYDAFELNAAQDDVGKASKQAKRDGLLIHDGRDGVTAGCIGIKGDFEQFKKDLAAEQKKNNGKLAIQVGTKTQLADVEKQGQRVADASGRPPGMMNLGGPKEAESARAAIPDPDNERAAVATIDMMIREGHVDPDQRDSLLRTVREQLRGNKKPEKDWFANLLSKFPVGEAKGATVDPDLTTQGAEAKGRVTDPTAEPAAPKMRQPMRLGVTPDDVKTSEPELVSGPKLVRGPAVDVGDETVATVNGKNQVATILDGIPDERPLSELPNDVRDSVMKLVPKDALKARTMPNGEKVAAVDVVTVGEIKKMFADEARAKQRVAQGGPAYSDTPVYRYLSDEDRRLMASKAQTAQRNKYLTSGKAEVEYIRKHGEESLDDQGRTLIERAQRVLLPNQMTKLKQEIEGAKWRYRMVNPIPSMAESEIQRHLDEMEPKPSDAMDLETYKAKADAHEAAVKMATKVQDKRQKDAAASVSGWQETDGSKIAPAPEVRNAMEAIARAKRQQKMMGTDANGNPKIVTEEFEALTPQQSWEMLIEARLEAQERVFGDKDDVRTRSITRAEAVRLLRFDANDPLSTDERLQMLRAAAERADRTYGKYARRVFDDAVKMIVRDRESAEGAAGIANKAILGERATAADVHRYQLLAPMDPIQAFLQPGRQPLPRQLPAGMRGMDGLNPRAPQQAAPGASPALMAPAQTQGTDRTAAPRITQSVGVPAPAAPQPQRQPVDVQDSILRFFGAR